MEEEKIENIAEIRALARQQAAQIVSMLEEHLLSEPGSEIRECPNCGLAFDLIEVGAEPKTPDNAWTGTPSREAAIQRITDYILSLVPTIEPAPPPPAPRPVPTTDPEIELRLKALEPSVATLKNITAIMSTCKSAVDRSKTEADIQTATIKALRDIDRALTGFSKQQQQ